MLPFIIIGVLILLAVMVYIGLREDRERDPLAERLAMYGERELPESLEEVELSIGFKERVLVPFMRGVADIVIKFTPQKQLEHVRHKLELAGLTTDPVTFFLQRIIWTIAFGIGAALFGFVVQKEAFSTAMLYTAGGAALGYYFPMSSLNSKIRKRQENIIKALPDALDLLVICVEAGLGFDMAMGKVYEKWDNELALAFGRVLREIQLGKLRREALKDMADRMDVPDVNAFTAAIIQADQLGVSMATILRVQSDQMRTKRRQRAQEKAQQAPVKMMIPMVLLIFPSIWIVLLGPAVLQVMASGVGAMF
ncbi:MAG: type II secretion system protein [Phototrophicales bacterium]|nr:MAG: type II secretion system protein [Phototrophicales bacterium]RMG76074.1 MAG: type II secretion system F family protein [Chloroflexota bacterium]